MFFIEVAFRAPEMLAEDWNKHWGSLERVGGLSKKGIVQYSALKSIYFPPFLWLACEFNQK